MSKLLAATLVVLATVSTILGVAWKYAMPEVLDSDTLMYFACGFLIGLCLFLGVPWLVCFHIRRKRLHKVQAQLEALRTKPSANVECQRLTLTANVYKEHSALDILSIGVYRAIHRMYTSIISLFPSTRILTPQGRKRSPTSVISVDRPLPKADTRLVGEKCKPMKSRVTTRSASTIASSS